MHFSIYELIFNLQKGLGITTNDCTWSDRTQWEKDFTEHLPDGEVFHGVNSYFHREEWEDHDDRTFEWQSCKISITNKPSK